MFTGIIESIGTIKSISNSKIVIATTLDQISVGDSVAVNGVCLSATQTTPNFEADYSPQTDKTTALSFLKPNSKVNLERALTLSSRLGGHIVTGHIDGTAKINSIEKQNNFFRLIFSCPQTLLQHCVDKGSIAIDGISLTISSLNQNGFETFIIPHTFNNTNMQSKKVGDLVNIETDIVGKYVEKLVNKKSGAPLLDALKENGFL
jgi:riboflavin synthase